MCRNLIRKLNSKKGSSLGEMMVCVLILLLASTVITEGIAIACRHFEQSFMSSQAQIICSTLTSAVENELRYTEEVEIKKDDGYIEVPLFETGEETALSGGNEEPVTVGGGAITDFKYMKPESGIKVYFAQDSKGRIIMPLASASAVTNGDDDEDDGEDDEIPSYDLVAPGTYSHKLAASVTVNSITTKRIDNETMEVTRFNVTISITKQGSTEVLESAVFDVFPVNHPVVTEKSGE